MHDLAENARKQYAILFLFSYWTMTESMDSHNSYVYYHLAKAISNPVNLVGSVFERCSSLFSNVGLLGPHLGLLP
jgi:hypothetical protein